MRRLLPAWLAAVLAVAACAEPPNKEMDQAQGAIDAARAVGAERYAADEYARAADALRLAREAVADGDYRLALNYALESREHAQNAARDAADARARLRGEVERTMAQAATLLARANALLDSAEARRVPRAALRDAQASLARVNEDVQKAGAAMEAEDYLAAQPLLDGLVERIEAVIAAVGPEPGVQSPRRIR